MRLQVGDTVKIKKNSKWNGKSHHNPSNTEGEIIKIYGEHTHLPINVKWDNNTHAYYDDIDLGLVRRA